MSIVERIAIDDSMNNISFCSILLSNLNEHLELPI